MDEDVLVDLALAGLFKGAADRPQRWGWDRAIGCLRLKEHPRRSAINADSQEGFVWKGLTPRMSHRPTIADHGLITGHLYLPGGDSPAEDRPSSHHVP